MGGPRDAQDMPVSPYLDASWTCHWLALSSRARHLIEATLVMEYNPIEIAHPLLRQRRYVPKPRVAVARRLPWDHGTNDIEPQRGSVPSVDLTFTAIPDGTRLWFNPRGRTIPRVGSARHLWQEGCHRLKATLGSLRE